MAALAQGHHCVAAALFDMVGVAGWWRRTDAAGQLLDPADPLTFTLSKLIVHSPNSLVGN
jgi:hypothetical protein